jgi:hypothetical protein
MLEMLLLPSLIKYLVIFVVRQLLCIFVCFDCLLEILYNIEVN